MEAGTPIRYIIQCELPVREDLDRGGGIRSGERLLDFLSILMADQQKLLIQCMWNISALGLLPVKWLQQQK